MFQKLRNPIIFQGSLKKNNYFEGWYYKMVTHDKKYTLALIPGISLNKIHSHAFIQVFLTNNSHLVHSYFEFDVHDFKAQKNPFLLNISNQYFSDTYIDINLKNNDISLTGHLHFSNHVRINTSILSPSIMGFFSYFKMMECYHGVVSMTHDVAGKININNTEVDFTNGKSYIEKDWGRSFPQAYVWMQSNHFKDNHTALMFSYATIPFYGLRFKGLIASLIFQKKEYRFATYNFSKIIKKEIYDNQVYFLIKKGKYKLEIKASNKDTISLASPRNGRMIESIKEGLSGEIQIKLYKKKQLIYEDSTSNAGLEIMM